MQFIIKRDKKDTFRFLPLQSEKAKQILEPYQINPDTVDTVVLLKDNRIYLESDAAVHIAQSFNYPWKLFYFFKFIPKFVRDRMYRIIAANRYDWFGKRDQCMIPSDEIASKFINEEINNT